MIFPVGYKAEFSICVSDGGVPVSGLEVFCSIRKKSNGKYFDGSLWVDNIVWLNTEETSPGIYVYLFDNGLYDSYNEEDYIILFKCEGDYSFYVIEECIFVDFAKQSILLDIKESIDFISNVEKGNWKIDTTLNQMIFYDENGNVLLRFNLYDSLGRPSVTNVYERRRV